MIAIEAYDAHDGPDVVPLIRLNSNASVLWAWCGRYEVKLRIEAYKYIHTQLLCSRNRVAACVEKQ